MRVFDSRCLHFCKQMLNIYADKWRYMTKQPEGSAFRQIQRSIKPIPQFVSVYIHSHLIQQRALHWAAKKEGRQIFSKKLLSKYEIPSAPALSSSLKALKEKGILDEEGTGRGIAIFDDPLFAIWLKVVFAG